MEMQFTDKEVIVGNEREPVFRGGDGDEYIRQGKNFVKLSTVEFEVSDKKEDELKKEEKKVDKKETPKKKEQTPMTYESEQVLPPENKSPEEPKTKVIASGVEIVPDDYKQPETDLVTAPQEIVQPLVSAKQAEEMWKQYQDLTRAILDPSDYQSISGKRFKKKSAWRKYARFFNLTDEIVKEDIERDEGGNILEARYQVKALATNGRFSVGVGSCSARDKAHVQDKFVNGRLQCKGPCDGRKHFNNPNHDIPATAHTRAKNRAISDLIGAGEVSAEEMR